MIKIVFISPSALKEKSVIQKNVDEHLLLISIKEYQDLEMEGLLGESLYDELSDELIKLQNGTIAVLPDKLKTLMEYVTPAMVYGSLMYSISPLHEKLTNKGVQHDRDINADIAELGAARSNYGFKYDGYRSKLIKHVASLNEAEAPCCCKGDDTTFNFTGTSLSDNVVDVERIYNDRYYKRY